MSSNNFFEFDFKTFDATFDEDRAKQLAFEQSRDLAKRMSDAYANTLKTTLLRSRKFATGDTMRSVESSPAIAEPSRSLVSSRVTASRSIKFIVEGRPAGKKAPPISALMKWASALGIPHSALFAIAKAISKRGIKAVDVQKKALNNVKPLWKSALTTYVSTLTRKIFRQVS